MSDPAESIKIRRCHYRRPFSLPLQAAWGKWSLREGILIRMENSRSETGHGEVAPLANFGSETLETAVEFMASLGDTCTIVDLEKLISRAPPACAFGLWAAMQDLHHSDSLPPAVPTAAMFRLDRDWQSPMQTARQSGIKTFKIKIGADKWDEEKELLAACLQSLHPGETVRLDLNRGWNMQEFDSCSKWLQPFAANIEFLEDPVAYGNQSVEVFVQWANAQEIPLALDESLSQTGIDPWLKAGWEGYWVIKPSLMGVPRWKESLDPDKVVLSSAFETGIGMNAIISLADARNGKAHGLGTGIYFDGNMSPLPAGGKLSPMVNEQIQQVWNRFSKI